MDQTTINAFVETLINAGVSADQLVAAAGFIAALQAHSVDPSDVLIAMQRLALSLEVTRAQDAINDLVAAKAAADAAYETQLASLQAAAASALKTYIATDE